MVSEVREKEAGIRSRVVCLFGTNMAFLPPANHSRRPTARFGLGSEYSMVRSCLSFLSSEHAIWSH